MLRVGGSFLIPSFTQPAGDITFFTGTQGRKSRKAELIQATGVLSLSVQREEFPYRYVTVEDTLVGSDQPPTANQMLAIAGRYLPERWYVRCPKKF